MDHKKAYERCKQQLLNDGTISEKNRGLFAQFLEFEEYKLKRTNGRAALDDGSHRTLRDYVTRLRVVNRWFTNKPWQDLTKEDIQRVYDDLEDGRITTIQGKPLKDRQTFYRKILRSKPFELAGKRDLVVQVMQFMPRQIRDDVRFIREEDFRKMMDHVVKPQQRAFLWLCWDIGENARSILLLRKQDLTRQLNPFSKEYEYLVNLRRETLKRSRTPRSELTNYAETVAAVDYHMASLGETDLLFEFGTTWAKKLLARVAGRAGTRCIPGGQRITLKDLRSSMACDLLSKGWSHDEVNARLGHQPSSRELDRYENYLAIDRKAPKRKFQEGLIGDLQGEMTVLKEANVKLSREIGALRIQTESQKKMVTLHTDLNLLLAKWQTDELGEEAFVKELKRLKTEIAREKGMFPAEL